MPERVLILLDEAYFEYARDDPKYPDSLHYRYDNVITLRTFSKAYGLAGLRIGYGFAHERLVSNLLKVKLTFEPSILAQVAAEAALGDIEFLHRTLATNAHGLRLLTTCFQEFGYYVPPSSANFILIAMKTPDEAKRLTEGMLRRGVIIRPLHQFGFPSCVRISTGTDHQMKHCIEAAQLLLANV